MKIQQAYAEAVDSGEAMIAESGDPRVPDFSRVALDIARKTGTGMAFVAPAAPREPSVDEIRRRAHQIFLNRAGSPGNEVLDWLIAELELRAEFRRAAIG